MSDECVLIIFFVGCLLFSRYGVKLVCLMILFFFFQAEDGIRDLTVTGVQTCALPISGDAIKKLEISEQRHRWPDILDKQHLAPAAVTDHHIRGEAFALEPFAKPRDRKIGRASCRERV